MLDTFKCISHLYVNRESRDLLQWIALVSLKATRCYMLSVIALADWRHRWPLLLFRRVCFIDVACQVSGQSSCLSSSVNGRP